MTPRRAMLPRSEVEALAASIAATLADGDAKLSDRRRLRLEGALAVLEVVLGRTPRLVADDATARDIASIL